MEIRTATEQDIPTIVDLLKKSLGEDLMPKSEAYWRWKHVDNPFGSSPVLLAFDDNKLVGIRAFMRWRWQSGDRHFEAVRAVDTATHPDYQGRGIFKKLTLALLDYCKQQGWHFVYNTPNSSSKPGYLKMGWQEAGKLPIHIQLTRPVSILLNVAGARKVATTDQPDGSVIQFLRHPGIDDLLQRNQKLYTGHVVTDHSTQSLKWRYHDVVVAQYYACGIESGEELNALLFYRIKTSKAGKELRITDIFMDSEKHRKEIFKLIRKKAKQHRADYISVSGVNGWFSGTGMLNFRKLRIGPVVTIRDITLKAGDVLHNFETWSPSVGDLELF